MKEITKKKYNEIQKVTEIMLKKYSYNTTVKFITENYFIYEGTLNKILQRNIDLYTEPESVIYKMVSDFIKPEIKILPKRKTIKKIIESIEQS